MKNKFEKPKTKYEGLLECSCCRKKVSVSDEFVEKFIKQEHPPCPICKCTFDYHSRLKAKFERDPKHWRAAYGSNKS